MLRFTIAILLAMLASGTAIGAERAVTRHGVHRTAVMLPAGLPRPHYKFRTTISYGPPSSYQRAYVRPFYGYESEVLFTPAYADVSYISPWIGTPLLPRYSTLPGYYGAPYSYDYLGPYYGGHNVNYWDRLPYACGVYGYC
ncbi:MAG TPA: hypothetical protein VF922_01430 [Bradyrhizobium sp.]